MTSSPLPERGLDAAHVFGTLAAFRAGDLDWRSGNTWAYVYDPGDEADAVGKRAYVEWLGDNALDPTVFPSMLLLETDLVRIARDWLRGDDEVVGAFTTGGTESILLAVKAAREKARAAGIAVPRMSLPETAHAAFHKAAAYLDVPIDLVPVDPVTFKCTAAAMEAAIGPDTALLVASAPSYAHGVIDHVEKIAALAERRGLWLHVDACMGGWQLPLFRRLGAEVPAFDFALPGVTSMSLDLHKYAYCPKGASLVLHRSSANREWQYTACAGWTGYTVVNPTMTSTRSGGPIAAAWAVVHTLGDEGYLRIARAVLEATRRIVRGVGEIEGLRVLGHPEMSLVAFASDTLDVFHVADEMKARGWFLQPQLGFGGHPRNVHISVSYGVAGRADAMLADLAEAVRAAARCAPIDGAALLGDVPARVGDGALSDADFDALLDRFGVDPMALPDRMATINNALDAMTPHLREQVLLRYYSRLAHPRTLAALADRAAAEGGPSVGFKAWAWLQGGRAQGRRAAIRRLVGVGRDGARALRQLVTG